MCSGQLAEKELLKKSFPWSVSGLANLAFRGFGPRPTLRGRGLWVCCKSVSGGYFLPSLGPHLSHPAAACMWPRHGERAGPWWGGEVRSSTSSFGFLFLVRCHFVKELLARGR